MLISRLHKFLTAPITRASSFQGVFWFGLSMTFAAILAYRGLEIAFSSEYVVQDDARQHVFWMRRFLDPNLFPRDLIADYFQSVAPSGYAALYQLMAEVGIDPLFFNKLLPTVLGLVTTGYCFAVCMQMLPVPMAGFIATLLLNQNLWLKDDLVSATARAFVYPLFLAFLYYLLRRSLIPCAIAIALLGLFYPQGVFLSAGVLLLLPLRWKNGWLHFSQRQSDRLFCAVGLGVCLLVMLPYALSSSDFGPVVTATEAKTLPEFLEKGRTRFFLDSPWEFWLYADRSGIFPVEWSRLPYNYFPIVLGIGSLLPLVLRFPSRFPLVRFLTKGIKLLPQIALVSLGLFFAAHALLFKLYLPSRYTVYSFRLLMALSAAMTLTVMLDAVFHFCTQQSNRFFGRQFLALGSTALLFSAFLLYPNFAPLTEEWRALFLNNTYIPGAEPALYEFFQQQPKDTTIASLSAEASQLPVFTHRSVLISQEHAIPYHMGYYRQFRQRLATLIRAQYSQDLADIQNLIRTYKVDFLLVERTAFTPEYMATNALLIQFLQTAVEEDRLVKITTEASSSLQQGVPALASVIKRCSVFETSSLVVLKAECISNTRT